jgi:uncharacterized OB-fold protein
MKLTASHCRQCGRKLIGGGVPCWLCGDQGAVVEEIESSGVVETFTTVGEVHVGEVRLNDGTLVIGRLDLPEPRVGLGVVQDATKEGVLFVEH